MTSTTKKKAPITRHPAFPATVALWFAALLGMGSLLVPPAVLESLVLAIRLDRLIPAAAPPLGFTARTLVAVLLAGIGGLIGFVVGRALGAAPRRRETPEPPIRRGRAPDAATAPGAPVMTGGGASDDNDDLARLEAARESQPTRRRGLNAQLVADPFADPAAVQAPEPAILNLGDLTAIEPIGAPMSELPASAAAGPIPPAASIAADSPPPVAPESAPLAEAMAQPAVTPAIRTRHGSAAQILRQAPLDSLGVVELVERFALALAERRSREAKAAPAMVPAPAPQVSAPEAASAVAEPGATLTFGDPNRHANGNLHDRGEGPARPFDMPAATAFASPQGTRDWLSAAERAADAAEAGPLAAPTDDHEELENGQRRSLAEGGWALPDLDDEDEEPELPAADHDPAGFDSDDFDSADGHLPEIPPVHELAAAEQGDRAFSSLLAIKPSVRQSALPPLSPAGLNDAADASPNPAGVGPEATEEALRKALATLQRMSGAA